MNKKKKKDESWRNYPRVVIDGTRCRVSHIVWEGVNGPLPKDKIIHHIDGNPLNNNIENLRAMTRKEHNELHAMIRRGYFEV